MAVKLWEQQPEESSLRFDQFRTYLLMARHERTIRASWFKWMETIGRPVPASGEPGGEFFNHANAWRWEERAAAYDRAEDRKMLERLQNRRIASLLEIADLGETLRKKAANAARMLTPVTQSIGQHDGREVMIMAVNLTPDQIVRMADIGTKIEQLALGNPTELTGFVEAPTQATQENARALLDKRLAEIKKRRDEADKGDR
jgi:hypothetical protein